ncbi:immunoglobulin superfamily member 6 isoform X6 [Hypomesus transpacificus]|uniref:immunoglobulin superfamily member 6 isoform X5 n=1 Tax=Hypomesus transpacificus TaxID=137520 RepID=UPI001F07CDC2|nr:immunoglobulin superfamily member 6 isoform X5 [Hypomesus transpacificus]XP_046873260.1 immunoglobulin superfamily member 6 isoform X6 [Hypomesus transpacificus]
MNRFLLLFLTVSFVSTADRMGSTPSCIVGINQPNEMMSQDSSDIILLCDVNINCSLFSSNSNETLWFVFNEHSLYNNPINLPAQSYKYSLAGHSLRVRSLHTNDSGVYHCAIVLQGVVHQGAQEIGRGTKLVVRDMPVVWHTLLWFLLVLLALYSLAVVVVIILKKSEQNFTICRGTSTKCDERNTVTKTKRAQFRAVVQELYGRKNAQNPKRSSQTKVGLRRKILYYITLRFCKT